MRGLGKHNKGFTLVEMLIVVAVIAVLVVVAIPIYNAQLEKTRTQVCLNNREVLRRQLYADALLYDDGVEIIAMAEQHMEDEDIICPSGGTISAWGDPQHFAVVCSEHTGTPLYNLANVLKDKGLGTLTNRWGQLWGVRIDSNGQGDFIDKVEAILEESKYNLGGNAINSWAAVRQGNGANSPFSIYWSEIALPERGAADAAEQAGIINSTSNFTVDSENNPVGGIPTIQYDDSTGLYSVGYMTLMPWRGAYAYNMGSGSDNTGFTPMAESSADVNDLVDTYNELLDKYDEKIKALNDTP